MQIMKLKRPLPGAEVGHKVDVFFYPNLGRYEITNLNNGRGDCVVKIPARDVSEWLDEDVPKRWKPQFDEDYYYITDYGTVMLAKVSEPFLTSLHELRFNSANCFRTIEVAKEAATKVKDLLLNLNKKV